MKDIPVLAKEEDMNPSTAAALHRALTRFFSGEGKKTELLEDEVGCSPSTYYRWRDKNVELMQTIEDRARLLALKQQRGEDVAWEARQKRLSHGIQEWAIDSLSRRDVQGALIELILGTTRTVMMGDEERHIVSYPRDQVQALQLLQEIARGGALPESRQGTLEFLDRIPMQDTDEEEEEKPSGPKLDDFILGIPTQFTKITAETANGRKLTAEVGNNVVEGEYETRDM